MTHIHVHVCEGDLTPIERQLTALMAKIDDLQTQFTQLDGAVRALMARIPDITVALEAEIARLRADDAVEDAALDGMTAAAADLRGAVEAFGAAAPDVPVDLPAEPTA